MKITIQSQIALDVMNGAPNATLDALPDAAKVGLRQALNLCLVSNTDRSLTPDGQNLVIRPTVTSLVTVDLCSLIVAVGGDIEFAPHWIEVSDTSSELPSFMEPRTIPEYGDPDPETGEIEQTGSHVETWLERAEAWNNVMPEADGVSYWSLLWAKQPLARPPVPAVTYAQALSAGMTAVAAVPSEQA